MIPVWEQILLNVSSEDNLWPDAIKDKIASNIIGYGHVKGDYDEK